MRNTQAALVPTGKLEGYYSVSGSGAGGFLCRFEGAAGNRRISKGSGQFSFFGVQNRLFSFSKEKSGFGPFGGQPGNDSKHMESVSSLAPREEKRQLEMPDKTEHGDYPTARPKGI